MVERTLSMREAQGSIPWFSTLFWSFKNFVCVSVSVFVLFFFFLLVVKTRDSSRGTKKQPKETQKKKKKKDAKNVRSPGIEPGSITWQATIITTRPRARYLRGYKMPQPHILTGKQAK